ncbi:MAG: condensation domain-containing protein, partial [Gemmatimonadota bacterium]
LPMTPAGKVDRRALPEPDARAAVEAPYVAPRTETETTLAALCAELLGVERVGLHDNFFELGGDSILSIQLVARAREAGLHLTPRDVFEAPRVAGLAARVGAAAPIEAEQGIVRGEVPLTPIQAWFFEQDLARPEHWNQAVLLETPPGLRPELLADAVERLLRHHDALRLRTLRGPDGWEQRIVGPGDGSAFQHVDLSETGDDRLGSEIESRAAAVQAGLDLAEGPIFRVVQFSTGSRRPGRLLLVAHHTAVDAVSWRVLLEDLQTTCEALAAGEEPSLPPKTTSVRAWAEKLVEHARAPETVSEIAYWRSVARRNVVRLPVDLETGPGTDGSERQVTVELGEDETASIVRDVVAAFRVTVHEVLLTATADALTRWSGSPSILIELEGHGREEVVPGVDLTRTVGWFTTLYPVVLEPGRDSAAAERLRRVKEELRRVPRHGIGFGLLRYLGAPEVRTELSRLPRPEVGFNYFGLSEAGSREGGDLFRPAAESSGPHRDPSAPRDHALELSAGVSDGRLRASWAYSESVHRRETVELLASYFLGSLRSLVAAIGDEPSVEFTPSDFPMAGLEQRQLDRILANMTNEDG